MASRRLAVGLRGESHLGPLGLGNAGDGARHALACGIGIALTALLICFLIVLTCSDMIIALWLSMVGFYAVQAVAFVLRWHYSKWESKRLF